MIALVSIALAAWEAAAITTNKPKVSDLSHDRFWFLVVWGWWLWLGIHFIREARKST